MKKIESVQSFLIDFDFIYAYTITEWSMLSC